MSYSLTSSSFSRLAFVSIWHVYSRATVLQTFIEAKETLEYVPIELRLYAKPFYGITALLVPA